MSGKVPKGLIVTESDEQAVREGCYYDESYPQKVKAVIEGHCTHGKGTYHVKSGTPFILAPWQWEKLIKPLYGWRRPDGYRRFEKTYVAVPKKNGKSTLMSALGLYHVTSDGEEYGEVYSIARDRKQAKITFDEAQQMIRRNRELNQMLEVRKSKLTITDLLSNSLWKVGSADIASLHGINASCVLFDEFHVASQELYDVIKWAGAARSNALMILATTAGNRQGGVCYDLHQHARKVLQSDVIDTSLYPLIYEASPADDPYDPETWAKANPSYGITLSEHEMRAAANECRVSQANMAAFKQLRLNVWGTSSGDGFDMQAYNDCYEKYSEDDCLGQLCYVGIDLGNTSDNCAVVAYFPETHRLLCYAWSPSEALQRRDASNQKKYRPWVDAGYMYQTPGYAVTYQPIFDKLQEMRKKFRVKMFVIDRYYSMEIVAKMQAARIPIEGFNQGYAAMNPGMKKLDNLIGNRLLRHNGNPVLQWYFENCTFAVDANGNWKPDKKKSTEKIDGVTAACMAVGRSLPDAVKKSVYSERGIISI